MRQIVKLGLGLATAMLLVVPAAGQDFPNRLVRIVSIAPPGSTTDTVGRLVMGPMAKALGQTIIMDNMPGGTGMLAHRYVARQPPDGYTLLLTAGTALAIPVYFKEAGFDIVKDYRALSLLAQAPVALVTRAGSPFSTLEEMVSYAKANPGKLNCGLPSSGDTNALFMEAVRQRFGIQVTDIAYKSGQPAYTLALLAGEIHLIFTNQVNLRAQGSKVKALAITGDKRQEAYPNVPTFSEVGIPEIEGNTYLLLLPANTQKAITDRLYEAVSQALKSNEVREGLTKLGFEIVGSAPDALARKLTDQVERFRELAKKAGIQPQ